MPNDALINEYTSLMDELAFDYISVDWDKELYDKYWKHDRPVFQERLKVVENELSYRNIYL